MAYEIGDQEAEMLTRIAEAIRGTDIGLKTIGENEDGSFSFVVVEGSTGVALAFTHPNPVKAADRFIAYAITRKSDVA